MIKLLHKKRYSPIGVDIGSRSVKLVQFTGDHSRLVDASRWDLVGDAQEGSQEDQQRQLTDALRYAREGRAFRGNEAVVCLSARELFLQNIRVPKRDEPAIERMIHQEIAARLPFPLGEAEIRYLETADVRQGDAVMREVIVMACHKPELDRALGVVEAARLHPVAVDVEPAALLRSCTRQFRRDQDHGQRVMIVHVGYSTTTVVIVQDGEVLFVKYIDIGGRQSDEAVARHLKMDLHEAAALRRHNGDRRSDQQDPEIARSVAAAIRPATERLATELSMCARYLSVTFRGQALQRVLLGGGEASAQLQSALTERLNMKCELSDPLRGHAPPTPIGRGGQWDIAVGLALREMDA